VVTGMGILSPVGNDLESSWDGIIHGRSGIGPITHFDASSFPTRIAGEIRGFDPTAYMSPKDVKKMDAFIHYGIAASLMAMDDSGLEVTE
jgi:3-oxoacyl-[acyl-carrier-protein] synthase II